MKLLVDRLSATPQPLAFQAGAASWAEATGKPQALDPVLVGPLVFELEAQRMGEDVFIQGWARGEFECSCSRCVARYRHALREPFRIVLEPAGTRVPADPEAAASLASDGLALGDELDAGWYRGHEIDLTRYLREVVLLALPLQPLCREDCRGLCSRCGQDQNLETCACAKTSTSSPFAALRRLRSEGD